MLESSIRTVIVDDEPLARGTLANLLGRQEAFRVVSECRNGDEAVAFLNANEVDLVFLDIQMPGTDGFQVIERLQRLPAAIVFVTAYDKFAVKAFEVNAIDYLLKPYSEERLNASIQKALKAIESSSRGALEAKLLGLLAQRQGPGSSGYLQRLTVKTNKRLIVVKVEDVDYIEANDYYAALHVGPKSYLIREPMAALERRLDPAKFVRVHRSTIINVERLREVRKHPGGGYRVVLMDGTSRDLSRRRMDALQSILER